MKKNNVLFLLLYALGICFTSCTRDFEDGRNYNGTNDNSNGVTENGNGNTTNGNGNTTADIGIFKAAIGGKAFVADEVRAIVNDDYIAISGLKTTGELIQISILDGKVGTYTFKDTPELVIAYTSSNKWAYIGVSKDDAEEHEYSDYNDNTVVKITEIDSVKKTISGTFQFTGIRIDGVKDKKEVTNGAFTKISYKSDAPILQPDNKFSAKLDGINFVTTNVSAVSVMGKIAITGNRGNVENVSLLLPDNAKEGTYQVDYNYSIRYNKNMSPDGMFDGKSGSTITILKHDKTKKIISGNFSSTVVTYTTTEKYEITDGSFNVSY
jgi:hypothetical protein